MSDSASRLPPPAAPLQSTTAWRSGAHILSSQDLQLIHHAALELLTTTGVALESTEALEILERSGASRDGRRARLTQQMIEGALETAPSRFAVAGTRGRRELAFGDDTSHIATCAGAPFVCDRDGRRPGSSADCVAIAALAHVSANIDLLACGPVPQDLPAALRYGFGLYATLAVSDKPTIHSVASPDRLLTTLQTAEILFGADWADEVRVLAVVNPTSPLLLDSAACRSVVELARRGQAVCVTPSVMGGVTGPVTLAGILTLQHAEVLAGLTLGQAARPGSPFVYGAASSVSSMQSGQVMMGVPQFWQLTAGAVELASFLGLPSRAGGSLTDAHVADMQAGVEGGLSLAASLASGASLVLHGTGALSSLNAMSFAKFMVDDEIIGMLRAAMTTIDVSGETIALDALKRVGSQGSFLTQPHTRRHSRDWAHGSCFNRLSYDRWEAHGSQDLARASLRSAQDAIARYRAPEMDATILRQLQRACLGEHRPAACDVETVLASVSFEAASGDP